MCSGGGEAAWDLSGESTLRNVNEYLYSFKDANITCSGTGRRWRPTPWGSSHPIIDKSCRTPWQVGVDWWRIGELIKSDVRYSEKWNVWPHEINISWMKVRVIWPPQRVKYFSFRPSSMCLGLVLANEHMIQNYTHINWMRGNVNWKTTSPCFAYILKMAICYPQGRGMLRK